MPELIGLLPAAGQGVRAYPYTERIPKSMLEVDGVPVLQRNVELMRDQLGIRDIRIVVGHRGDVIQRHLRDGSQLGVQISYVTNPRIDLELPYSVHLAGRDIHSHCCMILADECYVNSNHSTLPASYDPSAMVTLSLINSEYKKEIRKNYIVTLHEGRIVDLVEKPQTVTSRLMGTGTYLLHPDVLKRLADAYSRGPEHGPRDWTSWITELARSGEKILPFYLEGKYVNINSRDDLNYANFLVRDLRFDERKTSLVYLIEDEEEAAADSVERFATAPAVDELIAVTWRSSPALERVARAPSIVLVTAPSPDLSMSELLKLGLDRASGDILLIAQSDDTFTPRDVSKLMVYLRDADMVVGTRTTRQMIEQGTNMRGTVRAAHILLAKLLQILWWRFDSRFTDIGCTYRGLWRSTYRTIRDNLAEEGPEVFAEMIIEVLRAHRRIIEIPINYYNRDLEFDYVRGKYQSVGTFARAVRLILRKRIAESAAGRVLRRRG
jgi:NDP-sugar pyrophosphorylase family protein